MSFLPLGPGSQKFRVFSREYDHSKREYIPFWDIRRPPRIIRAILKDAAYRQRYHLFLKRLKAARHQTGLTQVEVARKLGRPQSFVSKCESGERRVDAVELQEFAHLYHKSLSYFVS